MTAPLSRRAVTSGLASSVPAIAAATAAPSVAASFPCNVTFSPEYPLQLDIQVRNNTVLDDVGRSVTRFATSWGSGRVLSYPMNNKPVGSVNHDFDWAFSGTLPGAGLGDNEADLAMDFGDGGTGSGRWTDYLTVTPLATSGAPTFVATDAADTPECRAYYEQRLAAWVSPFRLYAYGPYDPYRTGDGLPIAAGTMVDSRRTGNHPTRLLADRSNGIF